MLSVSNHTQIKVLKQIYIEKLGDKDLKIENLRMFCLGKELSNDLYLYTYDIIDEITVQALIKK